MKNVIGLLVLSTLVLASCADTDMNDTPEVSVNPTTEISDMDSMDNMDEMGMEDQNMNEEGVMV
jgi:PBP1b-binding outer membrane lipoprotein LpoB